MSDSNFDSNRRALLGGLCYIVTNSLAGIPYAISQQQSPVPHTGRISHAQALKFPEFREMYAKQQFSHLVNNGFIKPPNDEKGQSLSITDVVRAIIYDHWLHIYGNEISNSFMKNENNPVFIGKLLREYSNHLQKSGSSGTYADLEALLQTPAGKEELFRRLHMYWKQRMLSEAAKTYGAAASPGKVGSRNVWSLYVFPKAFQSHTFGGFTYSKTIDMFPKNHFEIFLPNEDIFNALIIDLYYRGYLLSRGKKLSDSLAIDAETYTGLSPQALKLVIYLDVIPRVIEYTKTLQNRQISGNRTELNSAYRFSFVSLVQIMGQVEHLISEQGQTLLPLDLEFLSHQRNEVETNLFPEMASTMRKYRKPSTPRQFPKT